MSNLPNERIRPTLPFEVTGVDYAGPFYILNKPGKGAKLDKCYLAIFVCFCTKAIHCEIVTDLTSNNFLACLKRFVSRRGVPKIIYSDNGTTFHGTNNLLKDLSKFLFNNQASIVNSTSQYNIQWKFIPPYTPNHGGLWEAAVKSCKFHLKRALINNNVTYEEMCTLVIQIEGAANCENYQLQTYEQPQITELPQNPTQPSQQPQNTEVNTPQAHTKIQSEIPITPHSQNVPPINIKEIPKHINRTTRLKRRNPVPWWNSDCESAIKSNKKAFNRYKRHNTSANKIEFLETRAEARRTIKTAKRKSWTEYVSTINSETPMTEVWERVRKISGLYKHHNIQILEKDGRTTTDNSKIVSILATTYKNRSITRNYDDTVITHEREEKDELMIQFDENEPINLPITTQEYDEALSSLKETSPGPNEIPVVFLKHLPLIAHEYILNLFNTIWLQHNFPEKWRESIIIPILKPQTSRIHPEFYRPISLTCAM
ncbi:uncharacterized protein LOC130900523 [Diorhabda carinulata]|uniref:uncharacterized protein LOC130900523 n=1 Tax=Diorhabda carinulata TaxID=1163345 RepID=UPI0025A2B9D8|nr:uncharacterized protein LOC130900523 [Diorhabda carinulata]